MPYNNVIGRTVAGALIPEDYSHDIIEHISDFSAAMSLFRKVPMSRAQQRIPAESALAIAYWVNGDTGLKQTTESDWANLYLNAEEVAAIVPIPEKVLDDVDYDIWGLVRPQLIEAIGRALDAAIFFGVATPATWPAAIVPTCKNGVTGNVKAQANTAATGGIVGDISDTMALVEADGFDVDGIVANRSLRGKLRQARGTTGEQLTALDPGTEAEAAPSNVFSVPIRYPARGLWPATGTADAEAVVGDYSQGMLGVRQDLTWKILDQALITDNTGAVVFNLAQQDMVALRVVARFGFQVANALTYDQPDGTKRYPFATLTT